jgi:hypothetical protein
MRSTVAGLLLLLFCSASIAATRTYDIDVVIFSHLTPQTVQSEQWPTLSNDIISAFDRNDQLNDIKPTYQLQREKNVLQRTPGYSVLYSGSFRRAWSGNGSSITIPVKDNALAGNITVTLGHYFDVHTDLLLTEPTALLQKMDTRGYFTHWNQSTYSFRFLQNRRMRSRELNYLGSPLMGVLIKMNPVSQP